MTTLPALVVAFLGGFSVMVLEIIGTRLLAKDFGSSFYVWTSQIGVVLVALSLGYVAGGFLADRQRSPWLLAIALALAALFITCIPEIARLVIAPIVERHPPDLEIPLLWQKLDPALGAALVFLPPCFALATLPPHLIRLLSRQVGHVGRISGAIYGAGSVGSIAGVFISGYFLIDHLSVPTIFRATGALVLGIAFLCAAMNRSTPAS